jgi:hypothetical protein
VIYVLTGIIAYLILAIILQNREHRNERAAWQRERAEEHGIWLKERQQLLDRIQASSFAEYKTQEVRVIKAQSGEKEPPKLEQL